jgi:hypothetical protein
MDWHMRPAVIDRGYRDSVRVRYFEDSYRFATSAQFTTFHHALR